MHKYAIICSDMEGTRKYAIPLHSAQCRLATAKSSQLLPYLASSNVFPQSIMRKKDITLREHSTAKQRGQKNGKHC